MSERALPFLTDRSAGLLLRSARALLDGRTIEAKKVAAEALRSISKSRTRNRAYARLHHSNVAP